MTPSVPPATGRVFPPTATDPPTPTPTTIHPTCALAVWPLLTVNVLVAVTGFEVTGFRLVVEFKAVDVVADGGEDFGVVVAGSGGDLGVVVKLVAVVGGPGGDDFGVVVDVGWELGNFGFWLVALIVGLTGVFGRIVGSPVGTFPLLFWTAVSLGSVFRLLV